MCSGLQSSINFSLTNSENYRRSKIGRELLIKVAIIAKPNNIGRLNVWCVKDNNIGQNFYKKIGAEKWDHIDIYSIQDSLS
ncbi:MAG: GNAT family N-acetyltransferase [Tatlockia sp.]|nr:GNAT family N-acetyltransferase [Tatlockia sp.]